MRLIFLIFVSILVSACAKGPDQSYQLAQQGLLSGDISRDGRLAAVGSVHHGGSLWDINTNQRLYSWNHKADSFSSFRSVAISGNGKIAVTTEEKSIGVWRTDTGQSTQFWEAPDRILAIALNASGTRALIGMRGGGLDYFDLEKGLVLHRLSHQADVRSVALSDDGKTGLSGSDDFSAIAWDLTQGSALFTLSLSNQIKTVALSASGQLAFTSAQREGGRIWEPKGGKIMHTLESRYTNFSSARFSEDEQELVLGTSAGQVQTLALDSKELEAWQTKPRQAFGGASSKAVLMVNPGTEIRALTSDGMAQTFKP